MTHNKNSIGQPLNKANTPSVFFLSFFFRPKIRVLWNTEYSIVLTKAAFVHAKYLELYSSGSGSDNRLDGRVDGVGSAAMVDAMVKTRAYVDSHRNCEDIAMQMVSLVGVRGAALLTS